ncbi:hypothetical protein WA026_013145 [Henosepilachna vigintioctopunctata]|uniref:Uncharacterized protein n=1 Tax=Henosepilachna vigintioctopunctata TaxID=420089 RepID=A0AAW1UL52_9CUCU
MLKLVAFFAVLGLALAAPKPNPISIPLTYAAPLTYEYNAVNPIYTAPPRYTYDYVPYAANYYNGYYNNLGYGLYL